MFMLQNLSTLVFKKRSVRQGETGDLADGALSLEIEKNAKLGFGYKSANSHLNAMRWRNRTFKGE
jgi:hypothetical protein